jgi:hypothetical protein
LKDGRRLSGEIVAEDDRYVSLRSGGVTRAYAKDAVATIERAARPSAAESGGSPPGGGADPAAKDKKKGKGDRRDAPLTETANAWLRELLAKSADADEGVRRSVAAAIVAFGPQALPAVREAQEAAADPGQKQFLGRIAEDLTAKTDRRMRGEPPMDGAPPGDPGTAPGAGNPRRALQDMVERLAAELELRVEQRPKVEEIVRASMKRRFEILGEARRGGLTQEQVAEKVAPVRAELLAQMKTVLDEPQYVLFEEMAAKLFNEPMRMPKKPAAPEAPAK